MSVGRMFVQEHFHDGFKNTVGTLSSLCTTALSWSMINIILFKQALEMIENIRESFAELLQHVSWMDDQTRAVAKIKVTTAIKITIDGDCLHTFNTVIVL